MWATVARSVGRTPLRPTVLKYRARVLGALGASRTVATASTPPGRAQWLWAVGAVGISTAFAMGLSHRTHAPNDRREQRLRNPTEVADCADLGLMTPEVAQQTSVVHIKGFLSHAEVEHVVAEIKALQRSRGAATIERNARGEPAANGEWRTSYLHTDSSFGRSLPWVQARLREAIEDADRRAGWELVTSKPTERVNFRTIECHEYGAGGRLSEALHYDAGSLVTIDVMLADPGVDFEGGELATPEASGEVVPHPISKGDAFIFVSHKYHNVLPVTRGKRMVLVAELWEGPERGCAHRCPYNVGMEHRCNYSLSQSHVASVAQNVALLG